MWFKNTRTGLIWLIEDEKHIQELKQSNHFVEIESPMEKPKDDAPKTLKHECIECDKTFKNLKALNAHNRMVHKKDGDK